MIITDLVVSAGLSTALGGKGARGILRGRYLPSERLFVAVQGQAHDVSDSDALFSSASRRLFSHRVFSLTEAVDIPLPYVTVRAGFANALRANQIKGVADLTQWTQDALPITESKESEETSEAIFSICCLEASDEFYLPNPIVCFTEPEDQGVLRGRVELVAGAAALPSNCEGLAPLEVLRSKRVAVVGLGSIGSPLAVALAAAGVGTLHLVDDDRLSINNLHRHVCDLRHVGRLKVKAVADLIHSYNLPGEIHVHSVNVVQDADVLWQLANKVDLIVGATDNVPSRRLLNYVCVHTGTPLLLGCAFHNARIGELIRVLPGRSACYECTRAHLKSIGALVANDENSMEVVPYQSQGPVSGGHSFDMGTRVDVSLIAHLQARAAITTLLYGTGHLVNQEEDIPYNYLTWGVVPGEEFPAPFAFDLPFSTNWMHIPQNDKCAVCYQTRKRYEPHIEEAYNRIMATLSCPGEEQGTA